MTAICGEKFAELLQSRFILVTAINYCSRLIVAYNGCSNSFGEKLRQLYDQDFKY